MRDMLRLLLLMFEYIDGTRQPRYIRADATRRGIQSRRCASFRRYAALMRAMS